MTGSERLVRVRASLIAAVVGWVAAMIVTLPIALFKTCAEAVWAERVGANSILPAGSLGGWRLLLWSLAEGAGIWFAWTLAIVFGAWLLGALPAIALVRETWLLRHKRLAVLLSALMAELVVAVKFQLWRLADPQFYFDALLLTVYSLLLMVFAAAAAALYLRLVERHRLRSIGYAAVGKGSARA